MATIANGNSDTIITGTNDNDKIWNEGENTSVDGGSGSDTIYSSGSYVTIAGGDGNDTIKNGGLFDGTLASGGDNVKIDGGADNDYIENSGSNVTISGSEGADNIINSQGSNISIDGGIGNDTIQSNICHNVTINGGEGDDSIVSREYNYDSFINGGAGNDFIGNAANNAVIDGGDGDDTISNNGSSVLADGGTGNDYIGNYRNNSFTINGGKGNDTISNNSGFENSSVYGSNVLFKYTLGDGNDYILGFRNDSTLKISSDTYSTQLSGDDIIVYVGDDSITLVGAASLSTVNIEREEISMIITGTSGDNNTLEGATINALDGDDSIYNDYANNVSIVGGAGNDTINTSGANITIEGGDGDDEIVSSGEYLSINAGAGNDYIYNRSANSIIDGGTGNDSIINQDNFGDYVMINGGAGDDYINNAGGQNVSINGGDGNDEIVNVGDNVLFQYSDGDGNDYISGFNDSSTLRIGNGTGTYSTLQSGDDIIVEVGEGAITLKDAASLSTVNIEGEEISMIVIGTSDDDSIENTLEGATINASEGNDSIYNEGANSKIDGGDGADTIQNGGTWNNSFHDGGSNVTINGGAGNDSIYNSESDSVIIDGGDGDDTIDNNVGQNVTISGGAGKDHIFNSGSANNSSINGGAGDDSIVNIGRQVTISGGTGDDTIYNNCMLQSNGNLYYWSTSDGLEVVFEYENGDGNDIIHGFNTNSTLQISGVDYSTQVSGDDIVVTVGDGSITLKGAATLSTVNIEGEEISMIITGTSGDDNIENTLEGATINALDGDDTINNNSNNVSINAGNGDDSINNDYMEDENGYIHSSNGGNNVTINGGDGDDTINNNSDNVLINGGNGEDYIHNNVNANNDTIDGGAGNDSIANWGSEVTISGGDGSDTISNSSSSEKTSISGGNGDDSIQNWYADSVTIDGGDGADTISNYGGSNSTIDGGAGNDYIDNSSSDSTTIDAGDDDDTVYNSGAKVSINGGAGDDYIHNFSDAKNATILGGEGNDNIHNEAKKVLFQYNVGDGNDTISGFNDSSTLQLGDGMSTYSTLSSGSNIIVMVGDNLITLEDAASLTSLNIFGNEVAANLTFEGTSEDDSINNIFNNVTINAGTGDDTVANYGGESVYINGGSGDDSIENDGTKVTINGDADDDFIRNGGLSVTINGGDGDDSISNNGVSVIIEGGDGNDTVQNYGANASINGGDGNNHINNYGSNVLIDGGNGSENISNSNENVTVYGGDGNDNIYNYSTKVSINGGDDNDNIYNYGEKVSINGWNSDDYIYNFSDAKNATIAGGKGNDCIYNEAKKVLFQYTDGDGADSIYGFNSDSTLQIGDGTGTYSTLSSDLNIIVMVGESLITLEGAANLSSLNIFGSEVAANLTVEGTSDNNSVENIFNNMTIAAHDGDDTIKNYGMNASISGGAGNDSIWSNGYGATINGGKGDDNIYNQQSSWHSEGENVLFQYTEGDGNDFIEGFNETSTLSIGDGTGTYSTLNSDSDIIVMVGDGEITLSGAANLSSVNIEGKKAEWSLDGSTATFSTEDTTLITVTGVNSTDGLSVSGKVVTINEQSLNQTSVSISDGYKLSLASDVTKPITVAAHWDFDGYTAIHTDEYISAGYSLVDNQITYNFESGGEMVYIGGVNSEGGLSINGNVVTVSESALNTYSTVTISGGYSLALGDVTKSATIEANWKLDGTDAIYTDTSIRAGYELVDNQIRYVEDSSGGIIKVSGVKSTGGLSIGWETVIVSASALNQMDVSISEGFSYLSLASDVLAPETTEASWTLEGNNAIYTDTSIRAGYELLYDNRIHYVGDSGGEKVTVSGVASDTGLLIDTENRIVTVGAAALNGADVSISGDYTLELNYDVMTPTLTAAHWDFDGYNAVYRTDSISAGYEVDGNRINHVSDSGGEYLVTVSGVITADYGLSFDTGNKIVTVDESALNPYSTVTISGDYSLALGDVTVPETTAASWDFDGYTAIHTDEYISAGYSLVDNQITYNFESGGEMVYISGVNSEGGLSINGNVVTVSESALNQSTVTITDGYTLKLANDVTGAETIEANWTLDGTDAIYTDTSIRAGYELVDNQIRYVEDSGGEKVTVSGVTSEDGLNIDVGSKIVTVGAAALNESDVSISEGYTLALGDVITPETTPADWNFNGNEAVYKTDSIRAGYERVADNQIHYVGNSGGEALVTVSGVTSKEGLNIDVESKIVTVDESALNQNSTVTISDNYTLALGSVTTPNLTSAHWDFDGYNSVYKNDYISAGYEVDGNQIVYSDASGGEELVTVSGVTSEGGLWIDNENKIVTVDETALNPNSTVTISDNYTLALGSVTKPSLTAAHWDFNSSNREAVYKNDYISAGYSLVGNQIVYSDASGGEDLVTVNGVTSKDGLNIDVENKVVTVSASLLNQNSTVTISGDGYTLALGEGVEETRTVEAGWSLDGDTKAVYKNKEIFKGYKVENNEISYVAASGGGIVITIEGVKSADGLTLNGSTVTISEAALNKSPVTITNGYFLSLENADALAPTKRETNWTFNEDSTVATYTDAGSTDGYKLEDNKIVYVPEDTGETVEITGVTTSNGLSINGKKVTVDETALSKDTVTITDGYELALGKVTTPTETKETWSPIDENGNATHTASGVTAGYKVENNEISYVEKVGGEIFTINGLTSTNGITIDGSIVTISKAALGTETVTISEGYTLALSDDSASEITKATWIKDGTTMTYVGAGSTAGYELENNEIRYVVANYGETFTINGVISADGITINDKEVTISAESLGTEDVTISDGYTLKLGVDVKAPKHGETIWTKTDNGATCRVVSTEGYTLSENKIHHVPADTETNLTVNGVISTEGLELKGTTVTVGVAALGNSIVTITDGYTLSLDDYVPKSTTTPETWSYDSDTSTATYMSGSRSEGYSLKDNHISHETEIKSDTVKISGVTSRDGITIEDKVITIPASVLTTAKTVEIDNENYTLKLGADVPESEEEKEGWTLDGNTTIYKTASATEGYKLSEDKKTISYSAEAFAGEIKIELSGVEGNPTFDETGKIIQFSETNLEENVSVVSNAGEYEFEIDSGDYSGITFGGSSSKDSITNNGEDIIFDLGDGLDRIKNNANSVSILGGLGNDRINNTAAQVSIVGGKGNDNVTVSGGDEGGNIFVHNTGDGNDKLFKFKANDTIKILGSALIDASLKGSDVVFNVGTGSITVKDGIKLNSAIKIVDADDKDIAAVSGNMYTTDGIIGKTAEDEARIILAAGVAEYKADSVSIADASKLQAGMKIDGGEEGVSLLGGAGKDTLISGAASDFELTGGKGNDVFVFSGKSNGKIKDYSQKGKDGKDKIVTDGLTFKDYEVQSTDVILTYEDADKNDRTLTIENGAGKEITFGTKSSTINIYKTEGIFDSGGKSITIASDLEKFEATKAYSKIVTVNGSLAGEVLIIGNKKANVIIASDGNSTLNGGKGNDTLIGGEGSDTFVFEEKSGNKLIRNYGDGDKISLAGDVNITEVKAKGDDLELKVGDNKITIEGGAGKKFTFIENGMEQTFTTNGLLENGDSASLTSAFVGNEFKMDDYNYTSVNASLIKKAFKLIGDGDTKELIGSKGNDTLTAGSGGSSLWGGKGNDTLYGEVGDDVFVFRAGDGSDTIFNFEEGDMLRILDKRGNDSTYSKAVFSGDTLTLSIKGGGKVIFEGVSSSDSFNINGTPHQISGKTLTK